MRSPSAWPAAWTALERILGRLQGFEPVGVFARDVRECLMLQLMDKNRYDPAMAALLDNLELLARRDMQALKRACDVDDEDLKDMIAELRGLTPRPGAAFGGCKPAATVVPDVYVREGLGGLWHVELNSDPLPRLLVDQRYHARRRRQRAHRAGEDLRLRLHGPGELAGEEPGPTGQDHPQGAPPKSSASRTPSWLSVSSTCAR